MASKDGYCRPCREKLIKNQYSLQRETFFPMYGYGFGKDSFFSDKGFPVVKDKFDIEGEL